MFWAYKDSKEIIELKKKNLFIAEFIGTNNFNWFSVQEQDKNLKFLIKKINLPSLNIPFERLHGNQFVHYFHVGEINWEPITITFVDIMPNLANEPVIPNWKTIFYSYLNDNLITEDNRTSMLDLATFCESITISSYATYISKETYKDKEGKPLSPRDLNITEFDKDKEGKTIRVADNRENVAEDFIIKRPKITKIDFGSLDYGSDEINEITVTFLPEWCEYKHVSDGDEQQQKNKRKKTNP